MLDQYLEALRARDPSRVKWAAAVKVTENNVELRAGDGLWGTMTKLDDYEMRFADADAGVVAMFGVVEETTERSPYAVRLKVVDRDDRGSRDAGGAPVRFRHSVRDGGHQADARMAGDAFRGRKARHVSR